MVTSHARGTIAAVIMGISILRSVAPAGAAATVGVYDENTVQANTVDFVAAGSTVTDSEFKARLATAFAEDRGGVIDGSVLGGQYDFGVSQTKRLIFWAVDGTNWGIGAPTVNPMPISGIGAFASTNDGGYQFTSLGFLEIQNGLPDEHIIEFGVTVLSITDRNYGNVTVAGRLSGGGTLTASSVINHPSGAGDTFYGLTAPAGQHFTGFSLTYDGPVVADVRLWFDDIGFITPEPSALALLAIGGLAVTRRRR